MIIWFFCKEGGVWVSERRFSVFLENKFWNLVKYVWIYKIYFFFIWDIFSGLCKVYLKDSV